MDPIEEKEKGKGKTKTREGNCQLLFWNIPIDLKHEFKVKCAVKGWDMQEGIINLINDFCKHD